jgi:PAS domain-containing protein
MSLFFRSFEKEIQNKKEEAVLQSEKRYHTLTEVSPVGIFHGCCRTYHYVNPAGVRFQDCHFKKLWEWLA